MFGQIMIFVLLATQWDHISQNYVIYIASFNKVSLEGSLCVYSDF